VTIRNSLTVGEMKHREWCLLAGALPELKDCNQLQQSLKWFAWGLGWIRGDGLPSDKMGPKYLRQIWRGLARGPYRVGVFQVERSSGRWDIIFRLDPSYAVQRCARRRRRCPDRDGLDAALEGDFRRRSSACSLGF